MCANSGDEAVGVRGRNAHKFPAAAIVTAVAVDASAASYLRHALLAVLHPVGQRTMSGFLLTPALRCYSTTMI